MVKMPWCPCLFKKKKHHAWKIPIDFKMFTRKFISQNNNCLAFSLRWNSGLYTFLANILNSVYNFRKFVNIMNKKGKKETVRKIMNEVSVNINNILKALNTFGNCQRPVFSLGVSHYNRKKTSLWKFGLNFLVIEVARKWWKKKHTCWTSLCAFR